MTSLLGPILAVSYDLQRMNALRELFDPQRYLTVPVSDLRRALYDVEHGNFRLVMLGATVPLKDKKAITDLAKARHPHICVVWSLEEDERVSPQVPADRIVRSGDVEDLMQAVHELLGHAA